MQKRNGQLLFSASDLVGYLECEHLTTLGLVNLETPLPKAQDDEQAKLIQDEGFAHEKDYLEQLRAKGVHIVEIPGDGAPEALAEATLKAMREGAELIFQAAFLSDTLYGRADFLRRVPLSSKLGDYSYEVADTKLARSPKAKFLLQLCFYSELLAEAQGVEPRFMHLALGDGTEQSFRVANYSRYFRQVRARFLAYAAAHPNASYPERCEHCPLCDWRDLCVARWKEDDHLNQIAGITRLQMGRLQAADVRTLERLATLSTVTLPKLQPETLAKLCSQAALQLAKRTTGESKTELLDLDPERRRGFYRLPEPDAGDVFFDLEGDPFEPDGLDYLFGLRYRENGQPAFRAFWAHDRHEERRAFEQFMDFIAARIREHPGMHIYHYAHYEPTALKRMMSLHGTREAEVDDLLRQGRLVDLYKVVREALRTSEEGLSLKDIESLYGFSRENEVATAGASIVYYERWSETRDDELLRQIQSYNEDDVRSTDELRDWLLKLRPADLAWFAAQENSSFPAANSPSPASGGGLGRGHSASSRIQELEARIADYEGLLLGGLPAHRESWNANDHMRELSHQLLGFYRRSAKPAWWALFARQDMTEDELIEDIECLGGLRRIAEPPTKVARSLIYSFTFPAQDTKLKAGDTCHRADTTLLLGTITALDEANGSIQIKLSGGREVPAALSIGPGGPINSDILQAAAFRFADSLIADDGRFAALRALLRKDAPKVRGKRFGDPLVSGTGELLREALATVDKLQDSYLFIQGPPGAGKTYTGSHLIVGLLAAGKRVGVSSNSHKAINNLLAAIERVAAEKNITFRGAKKGTKNDPDTHFDGTQIEDVFESEAAMEGSYDLLAGTAWLFAQPELEESLDYLFVDEAGQVSLGNLVAMGTAARNIVLLGDQMQLGQPIQGVHPGRSGESTLEYLLDGAATIAPDRGIFLPTSRRMHESVCRFISEAVYDGRLNPEPANQTRQLILTRTRHPTLRPAGIGFVGLKHECCSQKSMEEADEVKAIYEDLLGQSYVDENGAKHRMGPDNVMVVAPYNAQVNLLRAKLPKGARVGTIDKFQGHEAEAVIVSMTTSSGEYLPRNIEFLYDKNRLNVAVSRAKCLAVVVASPNLLHIRCTTPEQIELVNTLCWVFEYAHQENM